LLLGAAAVTGRVVVLFVSLLWRELGLRRRAEAALDERRRLEAHGRITGGVAHGFNSLLMVVHGSAEALCRRVPLTDKAKLYADAITPRAGIADRGQAGRIWKRRYSRCSPVRPRRQRCSNEHGSSANSVLVR